METKITHRITYKNKQMFFTHTSTQKNFNVTKKVQISFYGFDSIFFLKNCMYPHADCIFRALHKK